MGEINLKDLWDLNIRDAKFCWKNTSTYFINNAYQGFGQALLGQVDLVLGVSHFLLLP